MHESRKKLTTLLQSSAAHSVWSKLHQLIELNKQVREKLDVTLSQHCQVANLRDGCLVIEVDSPAWATRLRYQLPELLEKLTAVLGNQSLKSIHYYVRPSNHHATSTRTISKPFLTGETANFITEIAQQMTDTHLKSALLRLAENKRKVM